MRLKRKVGGSSFLWSDAWLMASIFWAKAAKESTTLDQILAYGDAINHALFTFEELGSGIKRLTVAGLLSDVGDTFEPAGSAVEWGSELNRLALDNVETMRWLGRKMGAEAYRTGTDTRNNLGYPGLTHVKYNAAAQRYRARAEATLRNLGIDVGA